ncbi:unnamed protein product [Rhizophagus irregularis]|uniref:Uncharacterized protein n=1 Tax=Rhizophagus irregularis TaxID=588596 RepID=A0A2I1GBL2_9GLOM|nr:hypothetical protein RhiirA4_458157 [Rhizophagus irregularis]CAB4415612.1 unnamed protein product [Rhizophagus irregularis]
MVKSNYSGLNPVVVQVLNNLQYRYSGETPEMWCSRVHYPFKKLLEYNPKYFSKNGFIQMIERSYKDGNLKLRDTHFIFIALVSSELSDNKIEKIYQTCGFIFMQKLSNGFKLRLETWVKRVWNIVRNDGTPDRKKYLGILSLVKRQINSLIQKEYDLHTDEYANCIKKQITKILFKNILKNI